MTLAGNASLEVYTESQREISVIGGKGKIYPISGNKNNRNNNNKEKTDNHDNDARSTSSSSSSLT